MIPVKKPKSKRLHTRKFMIQLSPEENLYWLNTLISWWTEVRAKFSPWAASLLNNNKIEVEQKIIDAIKKSKDGWDNNPKDFKQRIKVMIGYDHLNPKRYKAKKWELVDPDLKKIRERTEKETGRKQKADDKEFQRQITKKYKQMKIDSSLHEKLESEIFSSFSLTATEKSIVTERVASYLTSYRFNVANDRMVLKNLILEEINLDRMNQERINEKDLDRNLAAMIDNSLKNISKMQDDLGVTAKQRKNNEEEKITLQTLYQNYLKVLKEFPEDKRIRFVKKGVIIYRKIMEGFLSKNAVPSYFPNHNWETLQGEIKWGVKQGHILESDTIRPTLQDFGVNLKDE